MFVHARSAVLQGSKSLMIKANDTDVVVLAISAMASLKELGLEKLWVTFGQGVKMFWIPVHELVESIGPSRSSGMTFFHAFTGCDVVSAFRGKGRKSAWQTWEVFDEVSSTFTKLSQIPLALDDSDLRMLEKFVVTMYDRSSTSTTVDDARLDLFARKQAIHVYPTHSRIPEATFHASCLSRRDYLGSDYGCKSQFTESCKLGMGGPKRTVGNPLDKQPTNCRKLPRADEMWMPEKM